MNNADRDASIFELTLRSIVDIRKETPEFQTMFDGLISIDRMIAEAILAKTNDDAYGSYIYVLMISGLCHKFLFDLMPNADIQIAKLEAGFYKERQNAYRQSTLQRNSSNIQPEGNTDN